MGWLNHVTPIYDPYSNVGIRVRDGSKCRRQDRSHVKPVAGPRGAQEAMRPHSCKKIIQKMALIFHFSCPPPKFLDPLL